MAFLYPPAGFRDRKNRNWYETLFSWMEWPGITLEYRGHIIWGFWLLLSVLTIIEEHLWIALSPGLKKMCLAKESKLSMELPCVSSLDNRKKVAFLQDNSAVWRSQLASGYACRFSFTSVVTWTNNRTKKRMDKSELWARGGKLLLCDYCKVSVVLERWIMSNRKTDMSRMSWQSTFVCITFY